MPQFLPAGLAEGLRLLLVELVALLRRRRLRQRRRRKRRRKSRTRIWASVYSIKQLENLASAKNENFLPCPKQPREIHVSGRWTCCAGLEAVIRGILSAKVSPPKQLYLVPKISLVPAVKTQLALTKYAHID